MQRPTSAAASLRRQWRPSARCTGACPLPYGYARCRPRVIDPHERKLLPRLPARRWIKRSLVTPHVEALGSTAELARLNARFGAYAAARAASARVAASAGTQQQETSLEVVSIAEGQPTDVIGSATAGPVPSGSKRRLRAMIVPPASANPGYGLFLEVPAADHISVCKPTTTEDVRFQVPLRMARDALHRPPPMH